PYCNLPHAREATYEEQVGDVDAGDEEKQRRRSGEHEHRRPDIAEDEPRQRAHYAAEVFAYPRRSLGPREEDGELTLCVGGRGAGPEPPDHVEQDVRPLLRGRRRYDWRPEVGAARVLESLRHDPDDRIRHIS